MNQKKVIHETNTTIIDETTGEVLRQYNDKTSLVEAEPPFVKMYIEDIMKLKDLPPASSKIMTVLLRSMGYNNVIALYMPIKKMLSKDLGISINTINKSIQDLQTKGLLIRKDRGLYIADPTLFGRGQWKDIRKLRMVVDYDEEGGKKINLEKLEQYQLELK